MSNRTAGAVLAGIVAVAAAAVAISGQSPADAPQFKTGVALLHVDASVVDGSGRAIADLTPADFEVRIDGRPRKVVFALFTGGAPRAVAPAVPGYAVNTGEPGRALAVMVDLASIRAGTEAPLLDTAAKLVERLRPSDAVALVPVPGPLIDLTRDHARVAAALRKLRGTSEAPLYRHYFTLDEAVAYERRDKRVMDEVSERECARDVEAAQQRFGLPEVCRPDLERETRERLWHERRHIETVLGTVLTLAQQLGRVSAPTTILLVSGGLGFDQQSLARFQQVETTLREAGLILHAVQVDHRESEAADARPAKASLTSARDLETGLANVATMAGGAFYAGVGKAEGVFERLRAEITETYELGVEAQPGDLDGKPHEVRITTSRKATVRSRRHVVVSMPPPDWSARLADLLRQPVDAGGLPIAAAAYSIRGEESATLKVLVRADVARGIPAAGPIRFAAAIVGPGDTAVLNVTGTAAPDGGILLSAQLAPGRYRMRLAAIDGAGRAGSVDLPLVAGLRMAGPLQTSDVIPGAAADGPPRPAIYLAAGDRFEPSLELTTADSARFAATTVGFEVRRGDEVVTTGEGRLLETPYDAQRIARASVATAGLTPGEYTLSAVVKVDGQPAARVSRAFVVEPAAAPAPTPVAPPAAAAAVAKPGDEPVKAPPLDPAIADLITKASEYVASYGEQMSAVVATEKYTQYVNPIGGERTRPRQIVADFALVKSGGAVPWTGYRDVMEVNGQAVADRQDRLMKILTESKNATDEASRLTAESARYNVGPVSRNFNVPTSALFFFHGANLSRFAFTRKGPKTIDGVQTVEIAFREAARPTIVTTRDGKDVPCTGTLWIAADGTIVRTRLQLKGFADALAMSETRGPNTISGGSIAPPAGSTPTAPPPMPSPATPGAPAGGGAQGAAPSGRGGTSGDLSTAGASRRAAAFPDLTMTTLESTADIEVTYRRDDRLGMWLPVRMTEEYQGAIPRLNTAPVLGMSRSVAVYSDYRRFETGAAVVGPKK